MVAFRDAAGEATLWAPMGLGLTVTRSARGLDFDSAGFKVAFSAMPRGAGTLDDVLRRIRDARDGRTIGYAIARKDFFVVTGRLDNGWLFYSRYEDRPNAVVGFTATWERGAVPYGGRIAGLMSVSFADPTLIPNAMRFADAVAPERPVSLQTVAAVSSTPALDPEAREPVIGDEAGSAPDAGSFYDASATPAPAKILLPPDPETVAVEGAGSPAAASGEDMAPESTGAWEFILQKSVLDGTPKNAAAVSSVDTIANIIGQQEHVRFFMRCQDGQFATYVVWPGVLGIIDDIAVRYRTENGAVVTDRWHASASGDAAFATDPERFVEGLAGSKELVFGAKSYSKTEQVVTFPIEGVEAAARKVMNGCAT